MDFTQENLARQLGRRPAFVIDDMVNIPPDFSPTRTASLLNKQGNAIAVIVSTRKAYDLDLPRMIAAELMKACRQDQDFFERIRLAMHETLSNSIMNGNLGMSSTLRLSAQSFLQFGQVLDQRLKDDGTACKPIAIVAFWDDSKLTLTIRDYGRGFIPQPLEQPSAYQKIGRGLSFIAANSDSTAIDYDGRQTVLTYFFKPEARYRTPRGKGLYLGQDGSVQGLDQAMKEAWILLENCEDELYDTLADMGYKNVDTAAGLRKYDLIISTDKQRAGTASVFERVLYLKSCDKSNAPTISQALKASLLEAFVARDLRRLTGELDTARSMQKHLFPTAQEIEDYQQRFDLSIGSYFESSSELGGDLFQLKPLDDQRLQVVVSDLSGHGVSAALNMFRLHTLLDGARDESPAKTLERLNQQLYQLLPSGQFATMLYGIIDRKDNSFTYSSAASPQPLLFSKADIQVLQTSGFPLGISKKAKYYNVSLDFYPGDLLFFYSDSVLESPLAGNRAGLDIESLQKLLLKHSQAVTANAWVDNLVRDFKSSLYDGQLPDDLTLLMIKRK